MANDGLPQLQACLLRAVRLGSGGSRLTGASNAYITNQFITVQFQPAVAPGVDWEVRNRKGEVINSGRRRNVIKWLEMDVALCTPDAELVEILSGGTVLTSGAAVGGAFPALSTPAGNGVSLEVWTKRIRGDALDATFPYARWVFPRVYLTPGSRAFANDSQPTQLSGFAIENPNWGIGPGGTWPVASTKVVQWLPVTAGSLPAAAVGYQNA